MTCSHQTPVSPSVPCLREGHVSVAQTRHPGLLETLYPSGNYDMHENTSYPQIIPPRTHSCWLDSVAAGFAGGGRSQDMQVAARKLEGTKKQSVS